MIRPGERAFVEAGENPWHGAGPTRVMTLSALHEADDSGRPVTWGVHVTDAEYGAAPSIAD